MIIVAQFHGYFAVAYRPGHGIGVTAFRAGDRADTDYREAGRQLGLAERELLVEPTQRFSIGPGGRVNPTLLRYKKAAFDTGPKATGD